VPPERENTQLQILTGWKAIANYLRKGVRTLQRYERQMGLPIHRPGGRSSVVAIRGELDNWLASRNQLDSAAAHRALDSRTREVRANFLLIDSAIGLTFSGMALTARDPDKRRRTTQAARNAYLTVMRLRAGTDLLDAERDTLEANLQRLRDELQSLGQNI
jgi:hypothetical protein